MMLPVVEKHDLRRDKAVDVKQSVHLSGRIARAGQKKQNDYNDKDFRHLIDQYIAIHFLWRRYANQFQDRRRKITKLAVLQRALVLVIHEDAGHQVSSMCGIWSTV